MSEVSWVSEYSRETYSSAPVLWIVIQYINSIVIPGRVGNVSHFVSYLSEAPFPYQHVSLKWKQKTANPKLDPSWKYLEQNC